MASIPEERHYPDTTERPELPASMRNALKLMYAGAGIAVVLGVAIAVTGHSRLVHEGDPTSGAYKAGEVIGGAITGLIAGGLWLWMASANKRGRPWARILSTVFFGLLTLYAVVGLVALPAAAEVVLIIEWAAGLAAVIFLWQRQSSGYYGAMMTAARLHTQGPGVVA